MPPVRRRTLETPSRPHFGRTSRKEAKSPSTNFDSHVLEADAFKSERQRCWIHENHRVANVKDPHQQRPHTVRSGENATRSEDPIDLGEQPVLQGR